MKCLNAAHRMRPDFVPNLITLGEFSRHPNISGYATHKGTNIISPIEVLTGTFL